MCGGPVSGDGLSQSRELFRQLARSWETSSGETPSFGTEKPADLLRHRRMTLRFSLKPRKSDQKYRLVPRGCFELHSIDIGRKLRIAGEQRILAVNGRHPDRDALKDRPSGRPRRGEAKGLVLDCVERQSRLRIQDLRALTAEKQVSAHTGP